MNLNKKYNSIKKCTIKVTVLLEKSFWIGLFERNDNEGFAVARKIFGSEPTDAELFDFVLMNFHELKFSDPQNFKLVIKRKNYKRTQREVRYEIKKAKSNISKETHAQEVLRMDIEKYKKAKKIISKDEKEKRRDEIFILKQEKKKKKQRGH